MSTSATPPAPSLRRPTGDRAIAGVASGLGRRFGISPTWFRVGFILLTVFGGAGAILYALGWLLIPEEGSDEPLIADWIDGFDTSNTAMVVGAVLIGVGAIILLSGFHFFPVSGKFLLAGVLLVVGVLLYRGDLKSGKPKPVHSDDDDDHETPASNTVAGPAVTAPASPEEGDLTPVTVATASPAGPRAPKPRKPPSNLGRLTVAALLIGVGGLAMLDVAGVLFPDPVHYLALTVGIIGLGLLAGALFGRARWLIIVGLILTPVLFLTSLGTPTWSFNREAGERYIQVKSMEDLERAGHSFEHAAGVLEIDLRYFDPPAVADPDMYPIPIVARIGAGEVRVWLPEPASAIVKGRVGIGSVDLLGHQSAGLGVSRMERTIKASADDWTFSIDAHAGVGSIVVTDEPWQEGWEG